MLPPALAIIQNEPARVEIMVDFIKRFCIITSEDKGNAVINIKFMPKFIGAVVSGEKTQTIRHARKFPPRPGDEIVFKCGDEEFGRATVAEVLPMRFYAGATPMIFMDGKVLSAEAEEALAKADGMNAAELKKFLGYYSRNKGGWNEYIVVRWKDFKRMGGRPDNKRGVRGAD